MTQSNDSQGADASSIDSTTPEQQLEQKWREEFETLFSNGLGDAFLEGEMQNMFLCYKTARRKAQKEVDKLHDELIGYKAAVDKLKDSEIQSLTQQLTERDLEIEEYRVNAVGLMNIEIADKNGELNEEVIKLTQQLKELNDTYANQLLKYEDSLQEKEQQLKEKDEDNFNLKMEACVDVLSNTDTTLTTYVLLNSALEKVEKIK